MHISNRSLRPLQLATLVALMLSNNSALAFDLNTDFFGQTSAYSATQTMASGRDSFSAEVHKEGEKLRMNLTEQGQNISMIMRGDKETNYMLMHDMGMFQEVKNKRIEQYRQDTDMRFENQKKVRSESANGYPATVYTADFVNGEGKQGSGTFWVTRDNIVVRAVLETQERRKMVESTMNLTNLQVGDQPDELFEVPSNYKSFGLGGLFSNAMRQSREPRRNETETEQPDTGSVEQPMVDQSADTASSAPDSADDEQPTRRKEMRKALGRLFGRGDG